jgi:peptidoglycan/xylan/chitin deacetylase (PgdA/CDA1 family)
VVARSTQVVNLCFHGIGEPKRSLEPGEDVYWISADFYRTVLDSVAGRSDVRLSFDDGNASDVEIGLPELTKRNLTATFFLLAGRMDQPGSVDRAGVRALTDAGMGIGSHGWHHRSWRRMDAETSHQEVEEAAAVLSETVGRRVDQAACPLGEYDRRSLAALREAGFVNVFSSDRRRARPGAWLQPRFSVRGADTEQTIRDLLSPGRRDAKSLARAAYHTTKRWR